MKGHGRLIGFITLVLCAALIAPAAADAAGTGDDPTPTNDVLSTTEALDKATENERFDEWISSSGESDLRVQPALVDAPYYYMWTPSHAQERSYWCGPATCQIIDDYWGSCASQATIARFLGTTANGTDFSRVDDALRYFTGRSYYYYGPLATVNAFMDRVSYGIVRKHYPMATDVNIDGSAWPNYVYDHPGHIIPMEAYDGRYSAIRVNDPYNEAAWKSGGGKTFGHMSYSYKVIWSGVSSHFRRAVVG